MNKKDFQRCAAVQQKQTQAAVPVPVVQGGVPVRAPVAIGPRPPAPRPPLGAYVIPAAMNIAPLRAPATVAQAHIATVDGGGHDE